MKRRIRRRANAKPKVIAIARTREADEARFQQQAILALLGVLAVMLLLAF
ncbi:MAG: hypothetical protein ACPGU7_02210 [Gammaproteobacteria bacterium]